MPIKKSETRLLNKYKIQFEQRLKGRCFFPKFDNISVYTILYKQQNEVSLQRKN